jgi:hypothetical protein
MATRSPEQNLIDEFVAYLKNHTEKTISINSDCIININCRSRNFSDIEFISKAGVHWVIEAKSDDSKDKHNTVHKIFGELLKETGRSDRNNCRYAILIPESSVAFYSRAFQSINREKFLAFGDLIPIKTVFTSNSTGIKQRTWVELYDEYKPTPGSKPNSLQS